MSQINRSITSPRLWFGIEKSYGMFLLFCMIILLGLGSIPVKILGFLITAGLWALLAAINRYDYIFFKVMRRHLSRPAIYYPHAKVGSNHYKKVNYKVK